jgi:hypothetical protein
MRGLVKLAAAAVLIAIVSIAEKSSAASCDATVVDALGAYYVVVDDQALPERPSIVVYQEYNGVAGLQRQDEDCPCNGHGCEYPDNLLVDQSVALLERNYEESCGAVVYAPPEFSGYLVVDEALLPWKVSVLAYQEANGEPELQRHDDACPCDAEANPYCEANADDVLFAESTTIGDWFTDLLP